MLRLSLVFIFCFAFSAISQLHELDLSKAGASCIPSGAAAMPNTRNFGGERPGLELRAELREGGANRACWDFPVQLNLSQMSALRIRFRCFNISSASQFNIYIQAGRTWYAGKFAPQANGKWEEIVLPKTSFLPEGDSDSWRQCQKIRIAAWRGGGGSLLLQFASFEFLPPNVSIALLRSGGASSQQRESYQYASHLGNNLSLGGLYPAVLEEDDCSARLLYPYQLLLLPYPAASSPGQINAVTLYLKNNGRAAVFHTVPPILAAQMQLPSGTFMRSSTLPAPLAAIKPVPTILKEGALFRQQSTSWIAVKASATLQATAWWIDSSGKNTGQPAILESPYGFWMTHVFLNQDSEAGFLTLLAQMGRFVPNLTQTAAASTLNKARFAFANSGLNGKTQAGNALNAANQLFQRGNYEASRDYANRCLNYIRNAETPKTPPRPNEFRAVWCRSKNGLPGRSWMESIQTLKSTGFNAIFPNLAHTLSGAEENSFEISSCLEACRKNGVALHLWLSCLGVGDLSPSRREQLALSGRLQRNEKGDFLPWLCPSQASNRQALKQKVAELAQRYPLHGLHLDLIRYPGSQGCYCDSCKAGLQQWRGNDKERSREQYRRLLITSLVQEIRQIVKKGSPEMLLSAAVYTDWQNARSTVGQDWVEWKKQGLVDFVCPMNYRASSALFASDLERQKQQLGSMDGLLPGIGVSSERLSLEELTRQIQYCRNAGASGFILFEYTPREAYDLLPKLQK